MSAESNYRVQLWEYYDRRAQWRAQDAPDRNQDERRWLRHALEYWDWLGVAASAPELEAEDRDVRAVLLSLTPVSFTPAPFLEVGSGPGTYTSSLPGKAIALDQSAAALAQLRARVSDVAVVRADALQLPLRERSVGTVLAAHIYGILDERDRAVLLREARRVASRLVVVDSGRPAGVPAVQWQQRTTGSDQHVYNVLRRHFGAQELADEIGGEVLFAGRFYVVVASES